jgi:anti-sigma B factor antagonist
MTDFRFDIDTLPECTLIRLHGKLLERYEAAALLEEIQDLALDGKANFVIDLAALDYLNSSGLSVIMGILTRARNADGEVLLIHISDKLRKLLVMTRLDQVFTIVNTMEQAKELFLKNAPQNNTPEHGH